MHLLHGSIATFRHCAPAASAYFWVRERYQALPARPQSAGDASEREIAMTFANETHRAQQELTLGSWFRDLHATLTERAAKYRMYRATLNELSSLSDRDLADLGLHRAMIADVAHDAAYKA
jgi:uncharacterized protein YjiS (DUF1127 family)